MKNVISLNGKVFVKYSTSKHGEYFSFSHGPSFCNCTLDYFIDYIRNKLISNPDFVLSHVSNKSNYWQIRFWFLISSCDSELYFHIDINSSDLNFRSSRVAAL